MRNENRVECFSTDLPDLITQKEIISFIDSIHDLSLCSVQSNILNKNGVGLRNVYRIKNYVIKAKHESDEIVVKMNLYFSNVFAKHIMAYRNYIVVEYIEGTLLSDIENQSIIDYTYKRIKKVIENIYSYGVIAFDLHEYNIIIDQNNNPMIIDIDCFETVDQNLNCFHKLSDPLKTAMEHFEEFFDRRERIIKKSNNTTEEDEESIVL